MNGSQGESTVRVGTKQGTRRKTSSGWVHKEVTVWKSGRNLLPCFHGFVRNANSITGLSVMVAAW